MKLFRFTCEIPGLSTDEVVETHIIRAEDHEIAIEGFLQACHDYTRVWDGTTSTPKWTLDVINPDGDSDMLWAPRPGIGFWGDE